MGVLMIKTRPTMADVAKRADVSKTTVSHVIHGTRFVSDDTTRRVSAAITELGYVPSAVARSLVTKQTGTIGMVIPDASNYHFGEMVRGVEDVLLPANYSLILCSTDEVVEREAQQLDRLLQHQVDGIIAAATTESWAALTHAQAQNTPVVFVDRGFEGLEGPFVGVDNERATYDAVCHLIERGHRRIGTLAGPTMLSVFCERMSGFRRALQEQKIPLREEWVVAGELSVEAGREATRQILLLPERPTALFLSAAALSLGALLMIRELGWRCPDDIALIGFGDHPWAAVSDPPLSVVRQPTRRLGQVAAEKLCGLLNGERSPQPRVILECELILRESC